MQISMQDTWTDEVLKEGCLTCLYNYKTRKNYSLFKDMYIDKLLRTITIMLAIFVFLFTIAFYTLYNEKGFILTFISFIPVYFIFTWPFIIYIIKISIRYNKTKKLHTLFNNQKEITLESDEFGIQLKDKDNIIKRLYYRDLLQVEFYKRVIVFRSKKVYNSFFISIKYEDDVKKELEKNHMTDLFKENLFNDYIKLEYRDPKLFTFLFIAGFIIIQFVSRTIWQLIIFFLIYWMILAIIFSKIDKKKLKFAMKKLNNKEIDKTIKYYNMLLNKRDSENFKLTILYYEALIHLNMNRIDEVVKILAFFDREEIGGISSFLKINYSLMKFRTYLKMKEFDKAKLLMDNFKRDIRFNINDSNSLKKYKEEIFNNMKRLFIIDTSNNKEELKMMEKYYLEVINNKQSLLVITCGYWENLMKIYKKLGNKKEEIKYRNLI